MGEYFLIVNPVKQQYIDASRFGENIRHSGILRGSHAAAVGLLICDSTHEGQHPLIGAWVGDQIIATGDYSRPNTAGFQTTMEEYPNNNLFGLAIATFEDISQQAIIMLCMDNPSWAGEFANRSMNEDDVLIEVGDIVMHLGCEPLRRALESIFGPDWHISYNIVLRDLPTWHRRRRPSKL
jgi:hypothetical protein